jgi:hypothetical protein
VFFFLQYERSKVSKAEAEAVDDEEDDDGEEIVNRVASLNVTGKNVNINKTGDPETEKKVSCQILVCKEL